MKRTLALLALLASSAAGAGCLSLNGLPWLVNGSPLCSATSSPFNLPQLTAAQAASMFTFEGSITIPTGSSPDYDGVVSPGGSLAVYGNTAYVGGHACKPSVSFCSTYAGGLAQLNLPTPCAGYSGGSGCTATVVTPPQGPGITFIQNYTLTSGYTTGDTCAVFSSLPPNITANNGWYLYFGSSDDDLVTSVGTCNGANSVGWATALTATYSSTVPVYQFNPTYPWCAAGVGCNASGVMVQNNKIYWAGAPTYDNGGGTLGWVIQGTLPISGTGWGSINVPSVGGTANTEFSRSLDGPIYQTPAVWAPYFGPNYSTSGNGLSIVGNNIPQGPSYQAFNTADITSAGATTPITTILLYTLTNNTLTNSSFSGPFPVCTQTASCSPSATGYPATLSTTPAAGDTSETISLPTGVVTATANIATSGAGNATITAINTGSLSDSAIQYTVSDQTFSGTLSTNSTTTVTINSTTGGSLVVGSLLNATGLPTQDKITALGTYTSGSGTGTVTVANAATATSSSPVSATAGVLPSATEFVPAYNYSPGTTLGAGSYAMGVPTAAATADSLTMTPNGYHTAEWTMTFSDGSSVMGSISGSTFTPVTALTGCQSSNPCTKNVTLAPMGDVWNTAYDGPIGTGFWVPGTSTFLSMYYHKNGPPRSRTVADPCGGANASTSFFALAPDTGEYGQVVMLLYSASDLYKQVTNPSTYPPYTAKPYATVTFPDESHLFSSSGCPTVAAYNNSWASFDYSDDNLWMSANGLDLYDYKLTPP